MEEKDRLSELSGSRIDELRTIQRAKILLNFAEEKPIQEVAKIAKTSRPTVYKCIKKASSEGLVTVFLELIQS